MRNPNRIPKILRRLQDIWERNPDLRLGQLIGNVYPCTEHDYVDTYYIARNKLRAMSRKSLKRLGDTLQLEDQKMNIPIKIWNDARDGDEKAIDMISERCMSDVRLTEEVYTRFIKAGLIDTLRRY